MIDFLDFILPPVGYGELRALCEGLTQQEWYLLGDEYARWDMESRARSLDDSGWDVYFGVMPRYRKGGTIADTWSDTTVLWADIDAKLHGGDKTDALDCLLTFDIPASVIVDSGHGYHAYWKLRAPVPFEPAAAAMKSIARTIGGDPVYDAARILRLPGLHNHKGGGSEPVRLIRFDSTARYRFSDFDLLREPSRDMKVSVSYAGEKRPIPDWLLGLIAAGAPKGQRSEACFKACLWLLRLGYAEGDIVDIFAANPSGIGAKFHEAGIGWLLRTIRKAGRVA